MMEVDFDAVRPYNDDEVREAIPRILADPKFNAMMDYLFEPQKKQEIIEKLPEVEGVTDFQEILTLPSVEKILSDTTDGIHSSGYEHISPESHYIFVANHRDIILDSSILGLSHLKKGYRVTQTTWGNNLMINQLIVDLGKSNQMITVFREGTPKELLHNSQRLSTYMRYSSVVQNNSIWIAQRKGRTKDGSDKTDVTILKMLSLSGEGDFLESLKEINLTPLAISYEWEPCDAMKVREIYLSQQGTYEKQPDEDFKSIIGGVLGQKGGVHLAIGTPLSETIDQLDLAQLTHNEILAEIAGIIDEQIFTHYRLWPSNYLAFDLLNSTDNYRHHYTEDTLTHLNDRYNHTTAVVGKDNEEIRNLFLKLYANPVINKLKVLNKIEL